tara:strand:- start:326 stop:679 length:354 start_codon:yes stop_codon:yes gene_type:complete
MKFYDENVKAEWTEEYGSVTTVTFMVYSEMGTQDNLIINHAIGDLLNMKRFAQFIEDIDLEKAELLNTYKGICVQWIFPDKLDNIEEIKETISDGLSFQRLKHECIGVSTDVYERTT